MVPERRGARSLKSLPRGASVADGIECLNEGTQVDLRAGRPLPARTRISLIDSAVHERRAGELRLFAPGAEDLSHRNRTVAMIAGDIRITLN